MRVLLKVSVPCEKGNSAIKDGSLPRTIQSFLETRKPEAAYFITEAGRRTMIAVLEIKASSEMPAIGEPFFANLGADVTFTPAMNAEDLRAGLSAL